MSTNKVVRLQRQAKRHQPAFDEQSAPLTWPTDALPPEWWIDVNRPIDSESYEREQIASANSGTTQLNGSRG